MMANILYSPDRAPRRINGNVVAVMAMLCWATAFPAAEVLLESWSTLALIAVRFSIALVFMILLWAVVEGPSAMMRARWGWGLVIGAAGFGTGGYLLLLGQALSDVVTVAIFAAMAPLNATLVEIVLDGRRLTRRFVFGLSASLVGGVVATGAVGIETVGVGALVTLLASLCYCWGSRAAVREFPELSQIGQTTVTLAGGTLFVMVMFIGMVLLGKDQIPAGAFEGNMLNLLLLYALIGMAISQTLWLVAVDRMGIAIASFHMNAAPFYVMLIMLALGAGWSWPQALGAASVGLGVLIAQR